MPVERPKILSEIVFPAAVTIKMYFYNASAYDTPVTAQVPAGTYFMANDNQDDDLIMVLSGVLTTAIRANGGNFAAMYAFGWINSDHKFCLQIANLAAASGNNNIKLAWSESTASLRTALGVGSSDEVIAAASGSASYTAPYHHAYGWYADEDGYLREKPIVDRVSAQVIQARSLGGIVKTQQMSSLLYDSSLSLYAMTEAKTHSDGTAYGSDPPYPYARNVAFECMWQEMIQGKRFRVYRNHATAADRRDYAGTWSSSTDTTVTATTSTWTVNQFAGMVFRGVSFSGFDITGPVVAAILSNTASVLTFHNALINGAVVGMGYPITPALFAIIDGRYKTYVLDASSGQAWAPEEIPGINRYSVTIPLFRYEA
jgi:hypothetical protein